MSPEWVRVLRDIGLMLLCIEAAVFVAVPGVALFFAQKYLRKGRRALHLPLLRVQVLALRAEQLALRASNAIAHVPIRWQVMAARVRGTARALVSGETPPPKAGG